MGSSRNLVILLLIFVTLLLGGVAVFISFNLSQQEDSIDVNDDSTSTGSTGSQGTNRTQPVTTCASDYCAGVSQCQAQGGTPGGNGPRPSGGNCSSGLVMCCFESLGGGSVSTSSGTAPTICNSDPNFTDQACFDKPVGSIQGNCTCTYMGTGASCRCLLNQVTCYKCSPSFTDGNACVSETYAGTTCPVGTSTSPTGCASAAGGSCPVETTCYRCTQNLNDGDLCESFTVQSSFCPVGTSTSSTGCASAIEGACPVGMTQAQYVTCYRCTPNLNDGNACESFEYLGSMCPEGSSNLPTACAVSVGGSCPIEAVPTGGTGGMSVSSLPGTAIFGDSKNDFLIFGMLLVSFGYLSFRSKIFPNTINAFFSNKNKTRIRQNLVQKESISKIESLKKSRERFANKIEKVWKKKI